MKWLKTLVTFTLAVMPVSQSFAQTGIASDSMIEGAKLCTRHLPRYEREYAIPTHLLSAIASTESGRYHGGLGMKLPWPWAINAEGKGYYFDTKEEAISAVHKLQRRGVQSIDVGCMQVNIYQHPGAFSSLSEAFEPQKNIAYAASFLRTLYDEGGTWKKAAANYHSRTPRLGKEYVGQVYDSWYTIIDKLRAARLQVPESSVVAMNELKNPSRPAPVVRATASATASAAPRVIHVSSVQSVNLKQSVPEQNVAANGDIDSDLPETTNRDIYNQEGQKLTPYENARMNSIKISSAEQSTPVRDYRSNIIVIPAKSDAAPAPVVARVDAPMAAAQATIQAQAPAQAVTPISIPASLAPTASANSTPIPAAEMKTADNTLVQAGLQTPVQSLIANPATGHATDANAMSQLSPAAGRHALAAPLDDRTGPNFIFND